MTGRRMIRSRSDQSSQILNNGLIGDPEYFFVTGVIHMLQIDQKLINDLYQLKTQLTGK